MLFSLLVLSACGKEDVQERTNQQHHEMQLDISAQLVSDALRAMDYKIVNGKILKALEKKEKITVYTCVYEENKCLFQQPLQWSITPEKKLKYNGSITLSEEPKDISKLRLIAVIGEAMRSREPNSIVLTSSYSESGTIQLLSSDDVTTINVPYIMEVPLGKDTSGIWVSRDASQIFKPYGHLVRFTMENQTGGSVTINGVSSNKFLAGESTLDAVTKALRREEYGTHLDLKLSKGVEIASGATSSESFVLWVPKMGADGSYSLDLRAEGIEDSRLYTTMKVEKSQGDYKDGKLYNAKLTLYKTCIPNPLSLLSEDVMNSTGTDFVNLRNSFKIDELDTYNGAGKVGYFQHCDAIKKFCMEKNYPSTGSILWHQPDFFEWNAILYDPRNKSSSNQNAPYEDRTDRVRVKVGVGTQAIEKGSHGYWKTISYSVHVPEGSKGTYQTDTKETRPTIATGKSFYILSFAKADSQLPDDKTPHRFPVEETNNCRYAFRYTVHEDHIMIDCAPVGIQEIQAKDLPNHRIFSGISVVSRKLPFYGISNESPFERKDNTGGNRRIIDYATNTRDEKGVRVIAAFSAPGNAVMAYEQDLGFPVALFKKVTD